MTSKMGAREQVPQDLPIVFLMVDHQDARRHFQDSATAKSFVDNSAQSRVVRLVDPQHAVSERA